MDKQEKKKKLQQKAEIAYYSGDYDLTIKIIEESNIGTNYDNAHTQLAFTLERDGKFKLAKEYYEKAIQLYPQSAIAYSNYANLLYEHFNQNDNVVKYYKKAIELNPNFAEAYNNLASVLVEVFNNYKDAKYYYEKAIEKKPNLAETYNSLGTLLTKYLNEHEKAREYFEKSIKINPNNIDVYENLGTLLKKYFPKEDTTNPNLPNKILFSTQNKYQINFISIENFKRFKKLKINLPSKINIILAQNGFGKTTFLQALTFANLEDENEDIKKLDFTNFLSFGSEKSNLILHKGGKHARVSLTEYRKKNHNLEYFEFPPVCLAYGASIFTKYEKYSYDEIVGSIVEGTNKWYHTKSIFTDFSDTFFDPLIILNKLSDYKTKEVFEIKEFIRKKINSLLLDYKIVEKGVNKTHYFKEKNSKIANLTTKDLSEGYRSNLILLADIIIRIVSLRKRINNKNLEILFKKIEGLIIIDEFDRHLHPSWQRVYVENLKNLLPNIQFVLTTHNPVAILGRKKDEVQELYFDEEINSINIRQLPETETLDAGTILLKHFGLSSILSIELQGKIDRFYEIKIKEKLTKKEEEELNKLEEEIADTDVGINIHDYRFLIFIRFLKQKGYDTRERLRGLRLSEEEMNELEKEFEDYYN